MTTRNVLFVFLCAVLPLWTITNGDETKQKDSKNARDPQETAQVTVVIDYGDGVEKHFTRIAWKDGLTVLEAMRLAQSHPRGIRFESKGNGASAFLTKIDDVANEGRGRNWMYRVNGKRANESLGNSQLAPRDSVLWKFE